MLPPLLADVNIAVEVVAFLRDEGVDVLTVAEVGWAGRLDDEILAGSVRMRRFVLMRSADSRTSSARARCSSGVNSRRYSGRSGAWPNLRSSRRDAPTRKAASSAGSP